MVREDGRGASSAWLAADGKTPHTVEFPEAGIVTEFQAIVFQAS